MNSLIYTMPLSQSVKIYADDVQTCKIYRENLLRSKVKINDLIQEYLSKTTPFYT